MEDCTEGAHRRADHRLAVITVLYNTERADRSMTGVHLALMTMKAAYIVGTIAFYEQSLAVPCHNLAIRVRAHPRQSRG